LSSRFATPSLIAGSGWVAGIRHVHSPNHDERPSGCCPDLIIVHGISLPPCEFGGPGIDQLFTNCLNPDEHPYYAEIAGVEVSAHFLIRRDGELVQYVDIFKRAWHAGQSSYQGRERCNDFAVGIELEGADDIAYESVQYETLAKLVQILRNSVATLEVAPLVGHSDVAPGRKTDPGPAFSWTILERLL
jgi:N-acetyl-anhydromuramoyl-L-alanine amidase